MGDSEFDRYVGMNVDKAAKSVNMTENALINEMIKLNSTVIAQGTATQAELKGVNENLGSLALKVEGLGVQMEYNEKLVHLTREHIDKVEERAEKRLSKIEASIMTETDVKNKIESGRYAAVKECAAAFDTRYEPKKQAARKSDSRSSILRPKEGKRKGPPWGMIERLSYPLVILLVIILLAIFGLEADVKDFLPSGSEPSPEEIPLEKIPQEALPTRDQPRYGLAIRDLVPE